MRDIAMGEQWSIFDEASEYRLAKIKEPRALGRCPRLFAFHVQYEPKHFNKLAMYKT
jgi:hypothetical protein